jgi:hypothetical protein
MEEMAVMEGVEIENCNQLNHLIRFQEMRVEEELIHQEGKTLSSSYLDLIL